jgi:uncharacterized integral membrane protein (TIGR00698 family)
MPVTEVERAPAEAKKPRRFFASLDSKAVFLIGLMLAASGYVSPPFALVGGLIFGLSVEHPFKKESSALSKFLLQASVVGLGFGLNLQEVLHVGRSGFVYTAVSITAAMLLGTLAGKLLHVGPKASYLITTGTAICGGSAIAAVAPVLQANDEEISVSMGTVFFLNSVALLIFPPIGHALHLTQNQFGLWAALAIHDTSSVVGASAAYGAQALAIGTTVKLARALWIVPVSILTALVMTRIAARSGEAATSGEATRKAKVKIPWFIALFCAASALSTYVPRFHPLYGALAHLGRQGLTATLFLIGTSLSWKTLQQVGVRPLIQGVSLWLVVGCLSLAFIYYGVISI